ncbi:hypothetical protein [uncultured Campylobacter sp.]|uniref:hypothetical protein n=1 Tax=uncultured Campylobacter sp. TaxID=218934 RepID=UPI00262DE769|nr:hypothetical protein [uncultured Campylobacter sp.]
MTKNITVWIFSVLFLLITCVGIKDFYQTMTYDEVYIGSHFGAGGLIYFKDYPLLLAILFGITVFLPPISVVMVLLFRKKVAASIMMYALAAMVFLDIYTFCFRNRWQLLGEQTSIFDIAILGIYLLYYLYLLLLKKHIIK